MDDNTVRRNLNASIILLVLCVAMCIVALLLHMLTIAVVMAVFALLQAYFCCIWLHRKRHPRHHFEHKSRKNG